MIHGDPMKSTKVFMIPWCHSDSFHVENEKMANVIREEIVCECPRQKTLKGRSVATGSVPKKGSESNEIMIDHDKHRTVASRRLSIPW